nr:hypothetical protein BaRGS_003191 [Batillaria attramentaria]
MNSYTFLFSRFDPDRFNVKNSKDRPTLGFSPFGFAGKRHCPAREFVYMEASILVATLISKFRLHLVEGQVVNPVDGNLSDMGKAGSLHEFLTDLHGRFGPIASFWWGKQFTVSIASPELFKEHQNVFDRPPLTLYTICQVAYEIADKWAKLGPEDHIPLGEHMFLFAVKAALVALMGDTFKNDKEALNVRRSYDVVWGEMEKRLVDPTIPDEDSPRGQNFKKAMDNLREIVEKAVKEREAHGDESRDFLLIDAILAHHEGDEEKRFADAISYMVVLTWAIYFLAKNPDMQEQLYDEVKSQLGKTDGVTHDTISHLKYLRWVLDEALRCGVVAPYAARYVPDKDHTLGGHLIPKGCPAYRFAYVEASILLATIIQRFSVSLVPGQTAVRKYGLVTHPAEEVWVKVTKRDGNLSDMGKAGSLHEFLIDLHGRFGPIASFWWGKQFTVSIASPELFKEHQNVFDRPPLTLYTICQVAYEIADKWAKLGPEDHIPLAMDNLREIVGKAVKEREAHGEESRDFLLIDAILAHHEGDEEKRFAEAITYMVAGFHTTGNLLTWAIYFLAKNPDMQEQLYEEIKSQLGQTDGVTHDTISHLKYLRWVLDEALRCGVVAPYAARYVPDKDHTLGGHLIPKGTPVIHALGVLLMDEKYWPDPEK